MTNDEVARFIRLRGTVRAAISDKPLTSGGVALANSYDTLRNEIRAHLPEDLFDEYDRLFPLMEQRPVRSDNLLELSRAATTATNHLRQLAGWLDGHIEAEKEMRNL